MFRFRLKDKYVSTLYVCFLLWCLLFFHCVSGFSNKQNTDSSGIEEFQEHSDWILAPFGESAAEILRLFFVYSAASVINELTEAEIKDSLREIARGILNRSLITNQIAATILMVFGCLCVVLLFFSPYFIMLFRRRQMSASRDFRTDICLVSPHRGWLIYEFLAVILVIVIFGGIVVCLSVVEFKYRLVQVFDFLVYVIEASYNVNEVMQDNFHKKISNVSENAFEVIRLMYDINIDIGDKFMNELSDTVSRTSSLAKYLQWSVTELVNVLSNDRLHFKIFQNTSDGKIVKFTNEYTSCLDLLEKELENSNETFGAVVDPLLDIPTYSPNVTLEGFDNAIEQLEKVSALHSQERFQNITRFLRNIAESPYYDPSQAMLKLREVVLDTEQYIRSAVVKYIAYVDSVFKLKDKENNMKNVVLQKNRVRNWFKLINVIILIFGMTSVLLGLCFLITFSFGAFGTKFFKLRFFDWDLFKSEISQLSGKTIIGLVYISGVFLAVFWAFSISLFIGSVIPSELCLSLKDKTLFVILDNHFRLRERRTWYSMYSSDEFNSTLNGNLENCLNDSSYISFLPDPIVNRSLFDNIKNDVHIFPIREMMQNALSDFPYINLNDSEIVNLTLDDVLNADIRPYFDNVSNLLNALIKTDAVAVLEKIKDNTSSENLHSTVENCMELYKTLMGQVSTIAAEEEAFNSSIEVSVTAAERISQDIEDFKKATDELVDYLRENTTDLYMVILNNTITKMIDDVHIDLSLNARGFRRSVSVCPTLVMFHETFLRIICQHILYPWSACWLGAVFVDIFLLVSTLLCLYSVPLFLSVEPRRSSLQTVINSEDVPGVTTLPRTLNPLSSSMDLCPTKSASTSNIPDSREVTPPLGKFKATKSEQIIVRRVSSDDSHSCNFDNSSKKDLKSAEDVESEVEKTLEEILKKIELIPNMAVVNNSVSEISDVKVESDPTEFVGQGSRVPENSDGEGKTIEDRKEKSLDQILREADSRKFSGGIFDSKKSSDIEKTVEEILRKIELIPNTAIVNNSVSGISDVRVESDPTEFVVGQASHGSEHSDGEGKAVEDRKEKSLDQILREADSKKFSGTS